MCSIVSSLTFTLQAGTESCYKYRVPLPLNLMLQARFHALLLPMSLFWSCCFSHFVLVFYLVCQIWYLHNLIVFCSLHFNISLTVVSFVPHLLLFSLLFMYSVKYLLSYLFDGQLCTNYIDVRDSIRPRRWQSRCEAQPAKVPASCEHLVPV